MPTHIEDASVFGLINRGVGIEGNGTLGSAEVFGGSAPWGFRHSVPLVFLSTLGSAGISFALVSIDRWSGAGQ
jgi:hypothetical protein